MRKVCNIWKIITIIILSAALVCTGVFWGYKKMQWNSEADWYGALAEEEKDWILSCQADDGLIMNWEWDFQEETETKTAVPYFSSFAALGLLSGTVTEEQAEGAYNYQIWYLDHLNRDEDSPDGSGTIYDYEVTRNGSTVLEESANHYDSADSYAAVFLLVAARYADIVDSSLLHDRETDYLLVIDALLRTLKENGLSMTKEEYPVQYLMDNAEVFAGLQAAENVLSYLGLENDERMKRVMQAQENLSSSIDNLLWNDSEGWYEIGLLNGDIIGCEGWQEFYPDGVCQLFPMCFGIMNPQASRSKELYQKFCSAWDWEYMEMVEKEEESFYWCMLAYAAALQKDNTRLNLYIDSYQKKLKDEGRNYPLHAGEAGWMAMACSHMKEYYDNKIW